MALWNRIELRVVVVMVLSLSGAMAPSMAGEIDVQLDVLDPVVGVCDLVDINITVSSNDASPQIWDAIDVIVTWDPVEMELLGFDDSSSPIGYFAQGFLNDPDDINDDLADGEVIWTGLTSPASPPSAPPAPDELIVTTLQFRAKIGSMPSTVQIVPTAGTIAQTRVLLAGLNITGNNVASGDVSIFDCEGDFDLDGFVAVDDLLALLGKWGTCPDDCCREDIDQDGDIDVDDMLTLLGIWGPCP